MQHIMVWMWISRVVILYLILLHRQAIVKEQLGRGRYKRIEFWTFSYGKQSLEASPFLRKGHFFLALYINIIFHPARFNSCFLFNSQHSWHPSFVGRCPSLFRRLFICCFISFIIFLNCFQWTDILLSGNYFFLIEIVTFFLSHAWYFLIVSMNALHFLKKRK